MFTIDRARHLSQVRGLGKPLKNPDEVRSELGDYVVQLEQHLGLPHRTDLYMGARFKLVEEEAKNGGPRPTHRPGVGGATDFPAGSRVRINSSLLQKYHGRRGTVVRSFDGSAGPGFMVQLDDDSAGPRYFTTTSLELETPYMTTIVQRVTAAISGFFAAGQPISANQAARELVAATKLASEGESKKKRAKKALTDLNLLLPEYRPGTVRIFEDTEFQIDAVTKEPGQRLDEPTLLAKMRSIGGLSNATAQRIMVESRLDNKAATSVVVTEK